MPTRTFTTHPVNPTLMVVAATSTAPSGVGAAQARAGMEGVVSACTDTAATLTLRWWNTALSVWQLADISASASGRVCEQYGYAQWLVPPGVLIHVAASVNANVALGGVRTKDGEIL